MTEPHDISSSISPQALKSFLDATGWHLTSRIRPNAEIWERGDSEILLPLSNSAPDYARRVRNFVEDLAREEHHTEEDVARELMYVDDDVINICLADMKDVLPLDVAAMVIREAKELTIVSACSAITRKAYHGHSRPLKARKSASIVGMGHTRRDCFIIPLVSPTTGLQPVMLGEMLDMPDLDQGVGREPEFFPRRVAGTMASVLHSIQDLITPDQIPGQGELQRAVLDGLSADACEATANMLSTPEAGSLDVTFRWALSAAPVRAGREVIDLPNECAEAIRHIGTLLRQQVTLDDVVLYGYVVSLERDTGDPVGTVKVRAFVDSRVRPVKVTLNSEMYHVASEANDMRMRVVVAGKLQRSSNGLLTMPRVDSFQLDDYLPMITTDEWAANLLPQPDASDN
jgi:hypothetical protein